MRKNIRNGVLVATCCLTGPFILGLALLCVSTYTVDAKPYFSERNANTVERKMRQTDAQRPVLASDTSTARPSDHVYQDEGGVEVRMSENVTPNVYWLHNTNVTPVLVYWYDVLSPTRREKRSTKIEAGAFARLRSKGAPTIDRVEVIAKTGR